MKQKLKPSGIWQGLWRNFPVPALVCILAAAVFIMLCFPPFEYDAQHADNPLYETLNDLSLGLMLALVVSTAASALLLGRRKLLHLIPLALAAGACALYMVVPMPGSLVAGIMLCGIILSVYGASRGQEPAVRLNQIAGWFFTCLGLSLVLYGAASGIQAAVTGLFFPGLGYEVRGDISEIIMICAFMLLAPALFLGGVASCKGTRFRFFSGRILLPLYLLLMAVLLAYVGKIVVTWEMPVGTMNSFAIAAAVMYVYFHLTLTGDESKLARLFLQWGAWLMLPVMAAQAVGVYIRVDAYGFTLSRLMGIGLTAVRALCIISGLFRRRANWLLPLAAVVALALPYASERLAIIDQESRLEAALRRNDMIASDGSIVANPGADLADRKIIYSAMDYLVFSTDDPGELTVRIETQINAALEENERPRTWFSDADGRKLLGFERPDRDYHSYDWSFNGTAQHNELDTSGYDYAKFVTVGQHYWYSEGKVNTDTSLTGWLANEDNLGKDMPTSYFDQDLPALTDQLLAMKDMAFVYPDVPLILTVEGQQVDLMPLLRSITEVTKYAGSLQRDFNLAEDRISLPDGRELYLRSIEISRYDSSDDYTNSSLTISGWLLTPEAE